MSDIPEEVLPEILSRLPVEPLLRFRCVSKSWRSLIDSQYFIKMHLNRSLKSSSDLKLILRSGSSSLYSIDFDSIHCTNIADAKKIKDQPFKTYFLGVNIEGSCNGLLCFSIFKEDVLLWNPSLKKRLKIPFTDHDKINSPVASTRISQYTVYGFGYDAVNDDYKVVRMVQFLGHNEIPFYSRVKVYSLKSRSWREIQACPFKLSSGVHGVYVAGALHWQVHQNWETRRLIAAFDLSTEGYRLVAMPKYNFLDNYWHYNVDVLGGCLSMICYYKYNVDIWMMKDYGVEDSWTKVISVSRWSIKLKFEYLKPMAYSKSKRRVLLQMDNQLLVWYDVEKKSGEYIQLQGVCVPNSFPTFVYTGSLVQLKSK